MIYPYQVILESCDKCNLACEGCYRWLKSDLVANTVMPWDVWKDVVDSLTWKPLVCAFSHGEIFLDPLLPKRLAYLAEAGHRTDFGTNGTLLREDVLDVVFSRTDMLYQIVVSLDGLHDQTRKAFRHLSATDLPKPVAFVEELLRRKALLANPRSFNVIVSMVNAGQDRLELEAFAKYWLRRGVDIVLWRKFLDSNPTPFAYPKQSCEYLNGHIATVSANGLMRICDRNVHCTWLEDVRKTSVLDQYNGKTMSEYRERFPQGPCATCAQVYSGESFSGQVFFADGFACLYRDDYYNQMFFNIENFRSKT